MPMDPQGMADLMESFMPLLEEAAARAARKQALVALAKGIVGHIQTSAQIAGPCIGLTSPPGGGPVTGTALIGPGSIV